MKVTDRSYVILFTALLTCAFTAAVMTVQVVTAQKIQRNEALRYERALVKVFGLGEVSSMSDEQISAMVKRRIDRTMKVRDSQTGREFQVMRAYNSDLKPGVEPKDADLLGVAFEVSGRGFWAQISGLLALKPDFGSVIGIVFLDHKETPGLGGRITESGFQDQFKGLNTTEPAQGSKFIYLVKSGSKDPNDPRADRMVDAITGATQTSMAVEKFINANLVEFRRAMKAGPIPAQSENQK